MTPVPLISVKQEILHTGLNVKKIIIKRKMTRITVFIRAPLWGCQAGRCFVSLPPRRDPDLAVSFHSASLPSFTQISSSSVNNSWDSCSASSSEPRMNWTRWDGVSDGNTGKSGKMTHFCQNMSFKMAAQTHFTQVYIKRQHIDLFLFHIS